MVKKILSNLLFPILVSISTHGQETQHCDSVYRKIKEQFSTGIGFVVYEKEPLVLNAEKLLVIDKTLKTKITILVEVIVDEFGEPQCHRVLRSGDKRLDYQAIKLVEELNFIPAKQFGKPVAAIMILPFLFDKKRPSKEKRR